MAKVRAAAPPTHRESGRRLRAEESLSPAWLGSICLMLLFSARIEHETHTTHTTTLGQTVQTQTQRGRRKGDEREWGQRNREVTRRSGTSYTGSRTERMSEKRAFTQEGKDPDGVGTLERNRMRNGKLQELANARHGKGLSNAGRNRSEPAQRKEGPDVQTVSSNSPPTHIPPLTA